MKLEQHKNVFYKNIGTYMALINNELKKEYPLEPLSNHIKMVGGYAFKSSHYLSEGIPVIRISDFQNEKIELTGVKYYEESDDLDRYELISGDVIIAMTGGTIGKLAIVQEGLGKLYLNQRVGKFQVLNPNEFEDEYVYWLARGIQDIVQNLGYGGAQPNVSNKQLEALEFAFPKRNIQKQIIAFLNDLKNNKLKKKYFNTTVENKIYRLQNSSVKLNQVKIDAVLNENFISKLKESILREAVQGKLTTEWRTNNSNIGDARIFLKRIQKEKAQLIKDKKIKKEKPIPSITKEEIPYELPEGWVWCRITELTDVRTGSTPAKSNPSYYGGNIPWYTSSATNDDFAKLQDVMITQKALDETNCKIFPSGSLIIAMYGQGKTRGQISELVTAGATNQAVAAMVFFESSKVVKQYLKYYFQKFYHEIRLLAEGGAQPNLNVGKVKATLIPLPPTNEMETIVQKVNALMSLCGKLEQEVEQSQAQSEQLIQSIMRESLEVNSIF